MEDNPFEEAWIQAAEALRHLRWVEIFSAIDTGVSLRDSDGNFVPRILKRLRSL